MTIAELKRQANSGSLEVKMVYNRCYKNEDLPERLQGWHKVVRANTVGLFVERNGRESQLEIPNATLVEYDGNTLTIYRAGERDLTPQEQAILDEWNKITETPAYRKQCEYDVYTDCSTTYYKELYFFRERKAEYLMGYEYQRGMKFDIRSGKVIDSKVKGEIDLKYEVRRA